MKKILLSGIIIAIFSMAAICPNTLLAASLAEEDQTAVAAYQNARQEYLQAVSFYQTARDEYLAAREKLKTLRNAAQTKETLEKAKKFLLKADQTMIKYLQMVRKKVEGSRALSESERQAALNEIDNDINWLTNKQAEIQAATTKEQLVSLASQVKNHWQKVHTKVRKITGQILAAKLNRVIVKLEEIGNRIETAIGKAKAAGRNTSDVEAWLADYQKNLNLAKEKYESAKAKFNSISNLAEANQLFNEATAFIKEANQYLRAAHKNLKEIVKELKRS